MKKLLLIIVVFALLIMQNCITVKGSLELIEDENKIETLDQQLEKVNKQFADLIRKCNNLALSLSQINGMLPADSKLANDKIIYQEVNRVLAGNGYPHLQRQVVIPPTPAIPPVIDKEEK